MKVYGRLGQTAVASGDYGEFEVDEDGAVEVPEPFGRFLTSQWIGGVKAWEDEPERAARLVAEDLERRRDPASLYDAVSALLGGVVPSVEVRSQEGVPADSEPEPEPGDHEGDHDDADDDDSDDADA